MKVEVFFNKRTCEGSVNVIREPGDPKFRDSGWGSGESRLLYHVKKELAKQGYDFIKKRMCKDGHLVDSEQQYLRERKVFNGRRMLTITNNRYAIEGADTVFNLDGKVVFELVNIYEGPCPKTKFKRLQKVFILSPAGRVRAKVKEVWFVGENIDHYIVEDESGTLFTAKENELEKR